MVLELLSVELARSLWQSVQVECATWIFQVVPSVTNKLIAFQNSSVLVLKYKKPSYVSLKELFESLIFELSCLCSLSVKF